MRARFAKKKIKIGWNMGAEIQSVPRYRSITAYRVTPRRVTTKNWPEGVESWTEKTFLLSVMALSRHTLTCNIKFSDWNAGPGQQKYNYMIETISR